MAELMDYASSARGLINMIVATVQKVKRNKKQCRELEDRVRMVFSVLNRHEQPSSEMMRLPGAREALDGLDGVLREAHELAISFQSKRRRLWVRRMFNAEREAEKLADVLSKIDFYLSLYPSIAHADMAHRLDQLLSTTAMSVIISAVAFAGFIVVSMVSRKT
jgi:hypothetical protein|uniref:Mixed lineage kinase domain-containing protein n=2 Tax=Oryza TaxID=4527 RepID=A0A0E0F8Q5_9ORYZ